VCHKCLNILVTPRISVFLENLIVAQLVKKFVAFYETQRFITMSTAPRYWTLSWVRWIQSTTSHSVSWRSISVPYTCMSGSSRSSVLFGFFRWNFICIFHLSCLKLILFVLQVSSVYRESASVFRDFVCGILDNRDLSSSQQTKGSWSYEIIHESSEKQGSWSSPTSVYPNDSGLSR